MPITPAEANTATPISWTPGIVHRMAPTTIVMIAALAILWSNVILVRACRDLRSASVVAGNLRRVACSIS